MNTIPEMGHGPIVLQQNKDGSVQLRDKLTRIWCACGKPAVEYFNDCWPPYQFKCAKHAQEAREEQGK